MMILLKRDKRNWMTKKKILLIVGGIILALLVGGGLLLWAVWRSTPEDLDVVKKKAQDTAQYENRQELVDEVNKKYGSNDYKGAISLIEGQQNASDVSVQLLLAGAYANSGDIKRAFDIYKRIDSDGKLPDTELVNLANMAERAGDTSAAIAAYKRAKTYAVSSKTISQDEIATYDYKINELEKKR